MKFPYRQWILTNRESANKMVQAIPEILQEVSWEHE
jgi:hypothetical protein